MNIEIPNDISERNLSDYEKGSKDNSYICSNDTKSNLLGKKTKRNPSDFLEIQKTRCDICIEFEKYSESKLIECKKCSGICHKRCAENDTLFLNKLNSRGSSKEKTAEENWECNRCMNSTTASPRNSVK